MSTSLLERGDSKGKKPILAALLVTMFVMSSFVALADIGSRQTFHPDLGIAEIWASDDKPLDGDSVTINIDVKNYAVMTAASEATLTLYEDFVGGEELEAWPIIGLAPTATTSFAHTYDTTGKRGTKILYAQITDIMPKEANNTYGNNNATIELNIFRIGEGFDHVYEGNSVTDIQGLKQYHGFLALYENARVTIENDENDVCDVYFGQNSPNQFGIILKDNAKLDIMGCKMYSNYPFYITLEDNAKVNIDASILNNISIRSRNTNLSASVDISSSFVLEGGLTIGVPWARISDSMVSGDFVFTGGNVDIIDSTFVLSPIDMASIDDTNITANGINFYSAGQHEILATGTSQVIMKKLWDMGEEKSTVVFDATGQAWIKIYRELEVHVKDTTDMPIVEATVEAYWESADNPLNLQDSAITDADGNVTFVLLSDILVQGNDGYMGNYEFVATFTDDRSVVHKAYVTHRLAMHPMLNYNSSYDELTIMFDPIPPKVCTNPYIPKGNIYNGASLGLTGCMQVTTQVKYINSTITVIQDHDFQSAIYVEGNGQLILENTSISSNHRMNIYVIGTSAKLMSTETVQGKSSIKANAVVGVDGNVEMSTVNINANIRGAYKSFKVGTDSMIRGTWLTEAASMSVFDTDIYSDDDSMTSVVKGGSISIGGGNFFITRFELNSTSLSAVTDADMWGNYLPASQAPETRRWFWPGSTLTLKSEGSCSVINSDIHYDIFNMQCTAFNAEKSTFNRDIIYGESATSGSLKSVKAPAVTVLGDATVKTFFYVTLSVTNALEGPIADAPITITRAGGGSDDLPKPTTTSSMGTAEFVLLAEKITSGNNHEWMGNYKVVVEGCSGADPFEFGVGGGQGDQHYDINFDKCVPAIEGLDYKTLELNVTKVVPPSNSVKLMGEVQVVYEGGISLPPGDVVDITVQLSTGELPIRTETMDGIFEVAFSLRNIGLFEEEQYITVNASYVDPSDSTVTHTISQTLNITVLPERPTKVNQPVPFPFVPGIFQLTDKDIYKAKESIVVSGEVTYDTGTPVPSGSPVTVQILGTTITNSSTTGAGGRFTIILDHSISPNKKAPYIIQTMVQTTHPYYKDLQLSTSKQDTVYINPQKEVGSDNWLLWILILAIIIIVVVVVAVLVVLRMKTWGTLVECGECGAFIAENATKCPKCGTEFETEVVKCSECDAWIPALATECPKCGVEFKKVEETAEGAEGEAVAPPPGTPGAPPPPPPPPPKPAKK